MLKIRYHDAADNRLLALLSPEKAAQLVDAGVARPVRKKNGSIVRLYSIPRTRQYGSAADVHSAASNFTKRVRDDAGLLIAPPQIREHKPPMKTPITLSSLEKENA